MLFLPFPIHPCIDASILLYTVCAVHAQPSCSVLDIRGTVTPSVRRVMHRTLSHLVCTLQPTHSQLQASRRSPDYLGRPNNRRRLPSSTCCNNVGPSFGKKRMRCPRSGLQMTRVRGLGGLPHIRVSRGPGRERLTPGEASMAVQQQLSWLW